MLSVTVGVAWPRRLLIVTISTSAVDQLAGVGVPQGVEGEARGRRRRLAQAVHSGAEVVGMQRQLRR